MCVRERERKEASCLDHKAGNLAREEEEHACCYGCCGCCGFPFGRNTFEGVIEVRPNRIVPDRPQKAKPLPARAISGGTS